jgi:zinc transport system substrate-binding protein
MILKRSLIWLLTIPLLLSGCGTTDSVPEPKIVVTTFVPYYVFTQNLAGNNVQLINLINNTQEPHDYQLKPSDIATLQKADLIIRNGLGIDDWVAEAAEKSGTKARIFTASDYITPLTPQHGIEFDASEELEDEHNDAFDPHLWVSPKNVLQVLPHLQEALSAIDTNHTTNYQENLTKYTATLMNLDATITQQLASYKQKQFISFHEAFQYFARDYGLVSAISIEAYPGKEPTPKYLQALIKLIKEKQLKVIFSEPQFSPRIVETLAQDLNLKVYSLDPMETGTASATFYEDITLSNLKNIVAAFNL